MGDFDRKVLKVDLHPKNRLTSKGLILITNELSKLAFIGITDFLIGKQRSGVTVKCYNFGLACQ